MRASSPEGRDDRPNEAGFTLIEVMVVMVVVGILAAVGSYMFRGWLAMSQQRGTSQSLVSQLRDVAQRSTSEGRTYCVEVDPAAGTLTTWRTACSSATGAPQGSIKVVESAKVFVTVTSPAPSASTPCPSSHQCVYFRPRGTADPATIAVSSSARAAVYTVHVEGLTSRVWM
jgi:prepilin-type N-terminal cleavage/methylation domain-containing protein